MRLFCGFLLERRFAVVGTIIFYAVFFLFFFLADIPVSALIYPTLLSLFAAAILLFSDYASEMKRHRELEALKNRGAETLGDLPEPCGICQSDLFEIISHLRRENLLSEEKYEKLLNETTEYYTLWAHQIKTPIAAMRLRLGDADSDEARFLRSELLKVEQYVEMVLTYLRLDGDRGDYVIKRQPLDPIVKGAVRRFSPEFIMRHIRLDYLPAGFDAVTDSKWLGFVIEQLVSNALKYTPEGVIRIFSPDESSLCISDTGIGIAPEDMPMIFEHGYTGMNGRTDRTSSGIGLYLCGRICRNLGISLTARSEVGKGTEMRLVFGKCDRVHE